MSLYNVHRNTISNWVAEGLRPSDSSHPYVFNGTEIKRFHDARRLTSKAKLRIGEFECFRCKNRVFPEPESLNTPPSKSGAPSVWGACPICGCVVTKRVNETNRDKILECANTNMTLASLDEAFDLALVGIVKDEASSTEIGCCNNDRIIREWLKFSGRWDTKTINAKLASIRKFEAFCSGKPFLRVTTEDATRFRESLKSRVEATQGERSKVSTVRHCASHLRTFFKWLVDQRGYNSLSKSLPDYFVLPKKFEALSLSRDDRALPSDEEVVEMIEHMPTVSLRERRDRAMVAIAFLAALRADTLTTLRLMHLNISNRVVIQDAAVSRTKNGKSLRINWFPLPSIFADVVEDWLNELVGLGFAKDDALFPEERSLQMRSRFLIGGNVPVMKSTYAVALAFRSASQLIGKQFSPHTAKHYIGRLGLKLCKTIEEQAAWSANMGHDGMEITRRYYQKMSQRHVDDVFEQFDRGTCKEIPLDDMILMLRFHEHNLMMGTPEFERAKKLVLERAENTAFE